MRQKNRKIFVISFLMIFICSLIPLSQIQSVNGLIIKEQTLVYNYPSWDTVGGIYNKISSTYTDGFIVQFIVNRTTVTDGMRLNFYSYINDIEHIFCFFVDWNNDNIYFMYDSFAQYDDIEDLPTSYILSDTTITDLPSTFSVLLFVNTTTNLMGMYYSETTDNYEQIGTLTLGDDKCDIFQLVAPTIGAWNDYTSDDNGIYTIKLSDDLNDFILEQKIIEFTGDFTNGYIYIDLYNSLGNEILHKYPVNATYNSLNMQYNSVITIYGIANEGYYFNYMLLNFALENDYESHYSGNSFTITDDCEITVIFTEWTEEFDNEVYLAVSNPTNDGLIQVQYNGDEYWVESFQNFTVPYNTVYHIRYFPQYNFFINWWYEVYYVTEGIEIQYNETISENPFDGFTNYADVNERVLTLFAVANSVFSGGATPTPTTATPTPTSTSTTTETWDKINSILEFLFGDEGLLGAGFGLVILLISLFIAVFIPQTRNLWGILVFMTIAFIINLVTGLFEIWTIIVLLLIWIAVILSQSGVNIISKDGGE